MNNFAKGMTFTMHGKEYEVLSAGNSDPSSCLVFVPRSQDGLSEPQSLRMWKAEARLARGDIMLNGYVEADETENAYFSPLLDPLEQIAELKKQITDIERRRVTLFKAQDPASQILLQDNLVRPNKTFDIWAYTGNDSKMDVPLPIQYIKLRGLLLALAGKGKQLEHFLFNISNQLSPTCRISGDTLSSEGKIRIDLSPRMQTIQGKRTKILPANLGGKIELTMDLRLLCQFMRGYTIIHAKILQAAYIRAINSPGLKTAQLSFPEIGEHMITIEGLCVEIFAGAKRAHSEILQ